MLKKIVLLLMFFASLKAVFAQKPLALNFAHAHNDYEKLFRKDFKTAIKAGCTSLEIDVYPHRNKLKIAHLPLFLGCRRDLETRYFKQLSQYLSKIDTPLYHNPAQKLILMIDIKRNPDKCYLLLRNLCEKYNEMLTLRFKDSDKVKNGPIQILLSGSKPYKKLLEDSVRYMQLDGNLGHIEDETFGPELMPRVSSSYRGHFKWRGRGEMSQKELDELREIVKKAHNNGRELRFWAMPNKLKVWNLMLQESVDWLNVDRLKKLKKLPPHFLNPKPY